MRCQACGGSGRGALAPGHEQLGVHGVCRACNGTGQVADAPLKATSPAATVWTPAKTARLLKGTLYVAVVGLAWFFYRRSTGGEPPDGNVAEPESPTPDDYSPWEPEQ